MGRKHYTRAFFEEISGPSRRSAVEIVPFLMEMLDPRSVIDVGCGVGSWLSVFHELGVTDLCGVDGDYVDRSLLQIPQEKFVVRDLTKPFTLNRVFDLVISLEVAEHLPPASAETFVSSLVELGPVILFSGDGPATRGGEASAGRGGDPTAEMDSCGESSVASAPRQGHSGRRGSGPALRPKRSPFGLAGLRSGTDPRRRENQSRKRGHS